MIHWVDVTNVAVLEAEELGVRAAQATIIDSVYKVTLQETPVSESNWRVVASGTWTPGQHPQLQEHMLPAEVVKALFNVIPSATEKSATTASQRRGRKRLRGGR